MENEPVYGENTSPFGENTPPREPDPAAEPATTESTPAQPLPSPYGVPYGQFQPAPRPPFVWDSADALLFPAAILMGYLFIEFILHACAGLSVPAFILGVYAVTFLYMGTARLSVAQPKASYALLGLVAALTLPFLLYDGSRGQQTPLFFFLLCVTALQLYTMLGCRRWRLRDENLWLDAVGAVVIMPFASLGAFWRTLGGLSRKGRSRGFLYAAAGILLAVPLLAIVGALLFSADAAFAGLVGRIDTVFAAQAAQVLERVLYGIPFATAAFGILYGGRYRGRNLTPRTPEAKRMQRLPPALVFGAVVPLAVLYILFCLSQLAYFFSAFSGLLPQGYTYAEYARDGFFELLVVCVINLGLLMGIGLFLRRENAAAERTRRILSAFFCGFSVLLAVASLSKMFLYMGTYGLTRLRLVTSWFMIGLALVFIYIALRQFLPRFPLLRCAAGTLTLMVLLFSYVDADTVIISYNIAAVETGRIPGGDSAVRIGGMDFETLCGMSDGIEPHLTRYRDSHTGPAREFAEQVLLTRAQRYETRREQLKFWNLATHRARR